MTSLYLEKRKKRKRKHLYPLEWQWKELLDSHKEHHRIILHRKHCICILSKPHKPQCQGIFMAIFDLNFSWEEKREKTETMNLIHYRRRWRRNWARTAHRRGTTRTALNGCRSTITVSRSFRCPRRTVEVSQFIERNNSHRFSPWSYFFLWVEPVCESLPL